MTRRGVRVADRACLESMCTAMYRGFESRPLRKMHQKKPRIRGVSYFLGRDNATGHALILCFQLSDESHPNSICINEYENSYYYRDHHREASPHQQQSAAISPEVQYCVQTSWRSNLPLKYSTAYRLQGTATCQLTNLPTCQLANLPYLCTSKNNLKYIQYER
jgi:hypothetical protein